jgi:hypothetical protein
MPIPSQLHLSQTTKTAPTRTLQADMESTCARTVGL